MREALQILLGGPVYHAFELIDHIDHCAHWESAINAKYNKEQYPNTSPGLNASNIDNLLPLGNYVGVTDMPAIVFSTELIAAFPNAKVVLVERDIEKWYTSFDETIMTGLWSRANNIIATLDPWWLGPMVTMHHAWIRGMFGGPRSLDEMRAASRDVYREHYRHVRAVTPPGRLLEYKLGSGWEPLCEFLGRPVPDVEFPRVNESAAMQEKIQWMLRKAGRSILYHCAIYGLPVVVAAGSALWYWQN